MAVLRSKNEKATGINRAELPNPARVAPVAARKDAAKKMASSIMILYYNNTLLRPKNSFRRFGWRGVQRPYRAPPGNHGHAFQYGRKTHNYTHSF